VAFGAPIGTSLPLNNPPFSSTSFPLCLMCPFSDFFRFCGFLRSPSFAIRAYFRRRVIQFGRNDELRRECWRWDRRKGISHGSCCVYVCWWDRPLLDGWIGHVRSSL
jgi:hypothetical protein